MAELIPAEHFDWVSIACGWRGPVREMMRRRLVLGEPDDQISVAIGLGQAALDRMTSEAHAAMDEWVASRQSGQLQQAAFLLELVKNRMEGRDHGPQQTRTGVQWSPERRIWEPTYGDAAIRAPFPSPWDLVPEPPDYSGPVDERGQPTFEGPPVESVDGMTKEMREERAREGSTV